MQVTQPLKAAEALETVKGLKAALVVCNNATYLRDVTITLDKHLQDPRRAPTPRGYDGGICLAIFDSQECDSMEALVRAINKRIAQLLEHAATTR